MSFSLKINGKPYTLDDEKKDQLLLEYLREDLDLTGTKNGCAIGVCGACTVLVDDKALRACKTKLGSLEGKSILTIEGLSPNPEKLHPLQQAFLDNGAVQCGFCTPGMVLSAHALLLANPKPSRAEIRRGINANLCRCTGYQQIVDAVEQAAESGVYHKAQEA